MIIIRKSRGQLYTELSALLRVKEEKNFEALENGLWKLNRATMTFLIKKYKLISE